MDRVYVLSNPSMPGIYKIGWTSRSVEERIKELRNTSVPTDFTEELSIVVQNGLQAEEMLHRELNKYRIASNREFFKADLHEIKKAMYILSQVSWNWVCGLEETIQIPLESYIQKQKEKSLYTFLEKGFARDAQYDVDNFLKEDEFYENKNGQIEWSLISIKLGTREEVQKMLEYIRLKTEEEAINEEISEKTA